MRDAESPLDFIKSNLRANSQAPQPANPKPPVQEDINPQKMAEEAATKSAESGTAQAPSIPAHKPALPVEAKPDASLPAETKKADPLENVDYTGAELPGDEGDDIPDVPNVAVKENFKKLRTKVRETAKTLTETTEKLTKAEKDLENYKTGAVAPDLILEKEAEIGRLSKYEKLFNFKGSKEYQRKYGDPLKGVHEKIKNIATDYNVPTEVIEQGLKLKGAELDDFLSDHFTQLSALEVKQLVTQSQGIEDAARAAEVDPDKALSQLSAEFRVIEEEEDHNRKVSIANTSKDSWNQALSSVREEGLASELILKENDDEFNQKFVIPTLTRAATEYGKIVKALAEAGLKHLPPDLAKAIAKMTQLAHATPIAIQSREIALKNLNEMTTNSRRSNGYQRPGIGSSGNGAPAQGPQRGPVDATAAAESILNKVIGSR